MGIGISFQNDTNSEFRITICLGRLTIDSRQLKPGEVWTKVDGGLSASMRYEVNMEDLTSPPVFSGIRYAPKRYTRYIQAPRFRGTKELRLSELTLAASAERVLSRSTNFDPQRSGAANNSSGTSRVHSRDVSDGLSSNKSESSRSAVISEAAQSLPEYLRADNVLLTGANNILNIVLREKITTRNDGTLSTLGPRDLFSLLQRHYQTMREKDRRNATRVDLNEAAASNKDEKDNAHQDIERLPAIEKTRSWEVRMAEKYAALIYLYQRALIQRLRLTDNIFRDSVEGKDDTENVKKNEIKNEKLSKDCQKKSMIKNEQKQDEDTIDLEDFLGENESDTGKFKAWKTKLQSLKGRYKARKIDSHEPETSTGESLKEQIKSISNINPLIIEPKRLCAWLTDSNMYIVFAERFFGSIKKNVGNPPGRVVLTLRRSRPVGKRIVTERQKVIENLLGGVCQGFDAVWRELLLLLTMQILSPFLPPPYVPSSPGLSMKFRGLSRVPPASPKAEILDALWRCKAPGEHGYETKEGKCAEEGEKAAIRIVETVAIPLEKQILRIGSSEMAQMLAEKLLRGIVQCYLLRALSHAYSAQISEKFNPLASIQKFSLIKQIRDGIRKDCRAKDTLEDALQEKNVYQRSIVNRHRSTEDLLRNVSEKAMDESIRRHNAVRGAVLGERLKTHKNYLLRATREDPAFDVCGSIGSDSRKKNLSLMTTIAQMVNVQDCWEIDAGFPGLLDGCHSADQARELLRLTLPLCECFSNGPSKREDEVLIRFERYARMRAEEVEFKRLEREYGSVSRVKSSNDASLKGAGQKDESKGSISLKSTMSVPVLQRNGSNMMLSPRTFKIGKSNDAFFADFSFSV